MDVLNRCSLVQPAKETNRLLKKINRLLSKECQIFTEKLLVGALTFQTSSEVIKSLFCCFLGNDTKT